MQTKRKPKLLAYFSTLQVLGVYHCGQQHPLHQNHQIHQSSIPPLDILEDTKPKHNSVDNRTAAFKIIVLTQEEFIRQTIRVRINDIGV